MRTAKHLHTTNDGPHAGNASNKKFWKLSDPPKGKGCGGWMWITRQMMASDAWRSLTYDGRRVLDCIIIEHLKQKRMKNGALVVPYADLVEAGVWRRNVKAGIENAVASGFIDVDFGGRSHGVFKRPNLFTLTWLPTAEGDPPSNRWRSYESISQVPCQGTREKGRNGRFLPKAQVPAQGTRPGSPTGNTGTTRNGGKPPNLPSSPTGNSSTRISGDRGAS